MKATGIVRRIDDLGRIVIPKEIRKTLKVKEGMPLEIYTDKEGGIILRKFLPFSQTEKKLLLLSDTQERILSENQSVIY